MLLQHRIHFCPYLIVSVGKKCFIFYIFCNNGSDIPSNFLCCVCDESCTINRTIIVKDTIVIRHGSEQDESAERGIEEIIKLNFAGLEIKADILTVPIGKDSFDRRNKFCDLLVVGIKTNIIYSFAPFSRETWFFCEIVVTIQVTSLYPIYLDILK